MFSLGLRLCKQASHQTIFFENHFNKIFVNFLTLTVIEHCGSLKLSRNTFGFLNPVSMYVLRKYHKKITWVVMLIPSGILYAPPPPPPYLSSYNPTLKPLPCWHLWPFEGYFCQYPLSFVSSIRTVGKSVFHVFCYLSFIPPTHTHTYVCLLKEADHSASHILSLDIGPSIFLLFDNSSLTQCLKILWC